MHRIRIGIGGWDFAPWRGLFYPKGLKKAEELPYTAARLTSIEVNGTFYRTQTPETFRQWHDATPDDFMFSIKASRGAAQRVDAAEAKPAVERFLQSGLSELGPKLGAILWQLPSGRKFSPEALAPFLDLLPPTLNGLKLHHALEAQHPSFAAPEASALLHERDVARVILDKPGVAENFEVTAGHAYLRLQGTVDEQETGYDAAALDGWAARLQALAKPKRPVFAYVIAGAKHRAPAAAMALIARLEQP